MKTLSLLVALYLAQVAISLRVPDDLKDGLHLLRIPDEDEADDAASLLPRDDDDDHLTPFSPSLAGEIFPADYPPIEPAGPPQRDNTTDPPDVIPLPVSNFSCAYRVPLLGAADLASARARLVRFCDAYRVRGLERHVAVSRTGTAVAYACNFRAAPRKCSRAEFLWAEEHYLDLRCGERRPGWVRMGDWGLEYGRAFRGMEICKTKNKRLYHEMTTEVWWGNPGDGDEEDK